jgi:hypothetical protein
MPEHQQGPHGRRWYRPMAIARSIAIRPKVYLAILAGGITATLLPHAWTGSLRRSLM